MYLLCVNDLIVLFFFQISKILKPSGTFISITFSQPHFRIPLLANPEYDWSIHTETLGNTFHYFCYIMRKGQKLSEKCKLLADMEIKRRKDVTNFISESSETEENEDFLFSISL